MGTAMVADLVAQSRPLVIFSKTSCCMSEAIKILLYGFGATPRFMSSMSFKIWFRCKPAIYELDELQNGQQLERELVDQLGRRPSVPAVFIGGKLVGGSNEIMSLQVKGELKKVLLKHGVIRL
ncbi:hypothetical protein RHSIM_Rhsim01G0281100 [Rhododendron simsii]|uniref:Glutaredoxin domain-containing protein n=1 Tax=Rhododendron simsii TaxID=118357 RepID=A0A834HK23_RHOSS|nr:hypothetical protein RHSIM_Rhsim01G0281100 [Rhododendron simsii]